MKESGKKHLAPEFVPRPLWGISASKLFKGRAIWKGKEGIRARALERAENRCETCGSSERPLVCHDQWRYDDLSLTANLVGFKIHCRKCDQVTHLGCTMQWWTAEEEDPTEVAIKHMCLVSGYSERQARKIIDNTWALWSVRSQKRWKVKIAPNLLHAYPLLVFLEEGKELPRVPRTGNPKARRAEKAIAPLALRHWVKHPHFGPGQIIEDCNSYWVIRFVTDGEKKITKTFQLTKGRPPHPWESNRESRTG